VIVLDASAAIELLLGTDTGRTVSRRIAPSRETLHAPHLIDLEVAQVLRRYVGRGLLEEDRAIDALTDLQDLEIVRYAHDFLLPRVWELRANATAYDAAYLALSELLEAPLLTADARLARVPDARARVEVVR